MDISAAVKLGITTNLLNGFNPAWDPSDPGTDGLFATQDQALQEQPIALNPESAEWGYPEIVLVDSAEQLLSVAFPYQVAYPRDETNAPDIDSGPLLISDADTVAAKQKLSDTLGVDLSKAAYGYALVRMTRCVGSASHSCFAGTVIPVPNPVNPLPVLGVQGGFRSNMTRLRHGLDRAGQFQPGNISVSEANQYIEAFARYGTHFVSKVTVGDTIFQVFAYEADVFARIKKAYADGGNPLSGPGATSFVYFTSSAKSGAFGFVSEYGKILSLAGSRAVLDSVAKGEWNESVYAETDSIFAPFEPNDGFDYGAMNQLFTDDGPIRIELASLAPFAEHNRKLVWRRIFKSALVQKFPTGIRPNFVKDDKRNFSAMIPDYDAGLLTTLATPTISTYKVRLDLSEMQFVAASEARCFSMLANVLQQTSAESVEVPGTDVTLVAQVFDMQTTTQPAQLYLTDAAYDSLVIACDEFLGALCLRNSSGGKHKTIVDGLVYESQQGGANDRYTVSVSADVRAPLNSGDLPQLINEIEFSLAFAEAVINNSRRSHPSPLCELMGTYLLWLGKLIPQDSDSPALAAIRLRAVALARVATDSEAGTFVPVLPASDYEQQVASILGYLDAVTRQIRDYQTQIAQRKQAEMIIDVAKTLNKNIVESGQLLSKFVAANAAQQQQMSGFYGGIITQQQAQLVQQKRKVADVEATLADAQADVTVAVEAYRNAVAQWQTMELIKFSLTVATGLFDVATAIAVPASSISAVKDLGLAVQRIQKFLKVLNALQKVYTDTSGKLSSLQNANQTLDALNDPITLEGIAWDEMSINFKAVLATGPSDSSVTPAKVELERMFALLVLRGKAWASAKGAVHGIENEIYLNQQRQAINDAQAKRLGDLDGYLKPASIDDLQRDKIDLVGLTGALLFQRNQMMGMLARAFVLQDQAMQYANLQQATPLTSFNLLQFRGTLAQQQSAAIAAKTALGRLQSSVTTPIEVRVPNIPVSKLVAGDVYMLDIGLDNSQFLQYVDARVQAVVAKVEGISGTDSGAYLLNLSFTGNLFFDRNPSRQAMVFSTPSRERTYEFAVEGNKPKFSDGGNSWSQGVNPVTPFGSWVLSLPKVEKNKGITFTDTTVAVTLSFVLNARINDAPSLRAAQALAMGVAPVMAEPMMLMAATAQAGPSLESVIGEMHTQGSALNGWDVAFNLSLPQINSALREQFDEFKKDPKFSNHIHIETRTSPSTDVEVVKSFDMVYGYPSLQFEANQPQSVNLSSMITSGSLESCTYFQGKKLSCDTSELGQNGEALDAVLPISKITGSAQGDAVLQVSLEMLKGSFKAKNIELSDVEKLKFNEALVAYFTQNPVTFIINSLDLADIATLPSLKPSQFLFKTLVPTSNRACLQLFISTGGRPALNYSQTFLNNVPDPIPEGSECSLMISTKVFFNDVLPNSLNKNGWVLRGVDPGSAAKAWSAKYVNGNVGGTVDLSALDTETSSGGQGGAVSFTKQTVTIPGGNRVNWSINGMSVASDASGSMKLAYSKDESQDFNVETCSKICSFWCTKWNCSNRQNTSTVKVDIGATLPLSISGSGRQQSIAISIDGKAVNMSGHMSGGGPCNCDDLEAQFNQQLRKQIPNQVKNQVDADFDPISVFALKNLLFPSNNYIDLKTGNVPGDVLITGTFTKNTA
jgi:hypothetical protein